MVVPNIIKGFDWDCHVLFVKFEQLSTVRFSAFAQVWKEMKFSLVFNGRRIKELVCFTTEALSYVKYYFTNSNSFLRRICALYILYGLYYKQPIQYRSKILITLDEWKNVKEFLNDLKDNSHTDALVILLKLIFDDAFEYAITNQVRYVPTHCRGLIHTDYNILKNTESMNINVISGDFIKIEEEYKEVKQQIIKKNCSFFNYASDNISTEFESILSKEQIEPTVVKPSTSKIDEGNKRRTLRQKCFEKKSRSALYNSSVFKNEDSDDD